MKKDRKISVTFFLNKNVKPDSYTHSPLLSGIKLYPLYLQVTYNRRNTQFRSFYHGNYSSLEEAFSSKEEKEHRRYEESLIKKVVEYEVRNLGKDFTLKGISDRYLNYSDNIVNPIDKYFRDIIYNAVVKTGSEFFEILDPWKLQNVSYNIYYNAAIKLHSDLNKKLPSDFEEELNMSRKFLEWVSIQKELIRLIDWLDHSATKVYEAYLIKIRFNEEQIKNMLSFVNRVIKISTGLNV